MITLKAAVVGLGNIGMNYDYHNAIDIDSSVLTHAAGFHFHTHYELIAGVDVNPKAQADFTAKYNRPAYSTVSELFANHSVDVVSIAVPTGLHLPVFNEIIRFSPKAILCEKPIALTVREGLSMKQKAEDYGTLLLVNYMRRFEPGVLELKRVIESGDVGDIYKGTMWYAKGILNNGSHFIDLLIFLFGEVKQIEIIDHGRTELSEAEPDLKVKFGNVIVYFLAGREENYSIAELELFGSLGRIRYASGGQEIQICKTIPNPIFPGYTVLEQIGKQIATDLRRCQMYVLDNLAQALERGVNVFSTGETSLDTLAVVERILLLMKEKSDAFGIGDSWRSQND